jgi:excinuclease ABC subunit C
MKTSLKEKVKRLPLGAGVYIMKSARGKVLYVGKASSLRKRVRSYFSPPVDVKRGMLLENVADIEYVECKSQEQALILEAALIKEKKPKYNVALRDDKSYPYIAITKEKFPRIFVCRPKKKEGLLLFGPYTSVKLLKTALKLVRKVFPYRSCLKMPRTPCLFYHLQLCPGPCAGKISLAEYADNVRGICRLLSGERRSLVKSMEKKMARLSRQEKYEEAAIVRDKILAIRNLCEGKAQQPELLSLKESLKLGCVPLVMEAIDVSCLAGKQAVGAVVVFKDGNPDKSSYRRYRIKEVAGIDDCAMVAEVVRRRYRRLKAENAKLPDLVIVDGGKVHACKAKEELDKLGLSIAVVGIAKRNEEVWLPAEEQPLIMAADNPGLHVVQRIRDEAHRFAHSYHLWRRNRCMAGGKDD